MDHTKVKSSHVASIGYDGSKEILEVRFRNGRMYRYYEVPLSLYKAVEAADSKGRYLQQNVFGQFREREL